MTQRNGDMRFCRPGLVFRRVYPGGGLLIGGEENRCLKSEIFGSGGDAL